MTTDHGTGLGNETAAEYEALTERVALLDDADRTIVEVSGSRARDMINGLVTNALEPVAEGRSVYGFMLTAKGRIVAEMRITPRPAPFETSEDRRDAGPWTGEVWLDVPAACTDALLAHLTKYVPPLYARFKATDATRLGVVGPLAPQAIEGAAEAGGWRIEREPASDLLESRATRVRLPGGGSTASPRRAHAPLLLVRRERLEGPGFDVYAPAASLGVVRSVLSDAVRALDGLAASRSAWEILRVELGAPAYGREITADTLPQETGQTERAINFEKGCYTGQEVVARIHYRGHVNRRLVGFASKDIAAPLASGSSLFLADRSVAEVGTAVVSPRFGPIALGYARREIQAGQKLSREPGGPADVQVCTLPFTSM